MLVRYYCMLMARFNRICMKDRSFLYMAKRTSLALFMCVALLFTMASCGPEKTHDKLKVVSTIGMIGDIVQNLGGDDVEAVALMGPGVDPHLYKATAGDIKTLSSAHVIFYNGLHLEAKLGEVLEKLSARKTVKAVTDGIPESKLIIPEGGNGQHDPHVWFDVTIWISATEQVRQVLVQSLPNHKDDINKRAEAYTHMLRELHGYVTQEMTAIPKEKRILVTAHDAFNYFGRTYGVTVVGLQGISTEAEAGTKDVQNLVNFIVEHKIPAIFVESSISDRTIRAVQAAALAKGWTVAIGGELFSDAMGDAGTVEGTYSGMVRHNVDTIRKALLKK